MMRRDARGRFLRQQPTSQLDQAYHASRTAMLDCLHDGFVDAAGLRAMQTAMASTAPNRTAFGSDRYDELRGLLDEVEQLPVREPVFVRQPPVINHPPHAWHHTVPYPYRLGKWDGPWLFVLALFAGGFRSPCCGCSPRSSRSCVVWCGFRLNYHDLDILHRAFRRPARRQRPRPAMVNTMKTPVRVCAAAFRHPAGRGHHLLRDQKERQRHDYDLHR